MAFCIDIITKMKFITIILSFLVSVSVHGLVEKPEAPEEGRGDDAVSVLSIIQEQFPGSLSNTDLKAKVLETFDALEVPTDKTLFAASICPDEINHHLHDFDDTFGDAFVMGGLAGVPFTGTTGFAAFKSHVHDDGALFVLYAPHVGISATGTLLLV